MSTRAEVAKRRNEIVKILKGSGWWTVDRVCRHMPAAYKKLHNQVVRDDLKQLELDGRIEREPYTKSSKGFIAYRIAGVRIIND